MENPAERESDWHSWPYNEELADANARLKPLLAEKQHQLSEASLDIAREVLHCVALPIIGADDCDMIVLPMSRRDSLLGNGVPLSPKCPETAAGSIIVSGLQGGDGDALTGIHQTAVTGSLIATWGSTPAPGACRSRCRRSGLRGMISGG